MAQQINPSIVCPEHNLPSVYVPAGVSNKTGKNYDASWGCQVRGCRFRQWIQGAPQAATPQAASPAAQPSRIPARDDATGRSIVAQCSMKAAASLYQGMMAGLTPEERQHMLGEMLAVAARINDSINLIATPRQAPRPAQPPPPPVQDWPPDEDSDLAF